MGEISELRSVGLMTVFTVGCIIEHYSRKCTRLLSQDLSIVRMSTTRVRDLNNIETRLRGTGQNWRTISECENLVRE